MYSTPFSFASRSPPSNSTHCAQRVAFLLDLLLRAEAEAPQHRQRRTPALQRVLEEERLDQHGEAQPAAPAREPGAEAGEREARREQLEGALDVPLAVEALEPLADARGIAADLVDALRDIPADAAPRGRFVETVRLTEAGCCAARRPPAVRRHAGCTPGVCVRTLRTGWDSASAR